MKVLIFAFICIALVFGGNLRQRTNKDLELKLDSLKGDTYTNTILSQLQLHLKSGGKVEEVIQYIKSSKESALAEKDQVLLAMNSEMEQYDAAITGFKGDIKQMDSELDEAIQQISTLQQEVVLAENQKSIIETELENLDERERNLEQARENDKFAFQSRALRDERAIVALKEIIPTLQELAGSNSPAFIQKTQNEIEKYVQSKLVSEPVKVLLQSSMKFNKAKLNTVIEKLQRILKAVEVGKANDESSEEQSQAKYEALVAEISTLRSSYSTSLSQIVGEISSKNALVTQTKATKTRLLQNIESTQTVLQTNEEAQESARAAYQRRLQDLSATANALQTVLDILEEGSDNLEQVDESATQVLSKPEEPAEQPQEP